MISENEKENREKLFRLMRENPELPVVAMVDSEVVADTGYGRWTGVFGYVHIAEYVIGLRRFYTSMTRLRDAGSMKRMRTRCVSALRTLFLSSPAF